MPWTGLAVPLENIAFAHSRHRARTAAPRCHPAAWSLPVSSSRPFNESVHRARPRLQQAPAISKARGCGAADRAAPDVRALLKEHGRAGDWASTVSIKQSTRGVCQLQAELAKDCKVQPASLTAAHLGAHGVRTLVSPLCPTWWQALCCGILQVDDEVSLFSNAVRRIQRCFLGAGAALGSSGA